MIGNLIRAIGASDTPDYSPASDVYKKYYDDAQEYLAPFTSAGTNALSGYRGLLANPGSITSDPGYLFQLKQGADVLANNALASGNFNSGNTAKALTQYGQDYASTKMNEALNRYLPIINFGYGASTSSAGNAMNAGNALMRLTATQIDQANKQRQQEYGYWGDLGDSIAGFGLGSHK